MRVRGGLRGRLRRSGRAIGGPSRCRKESRRVARGHRYLGWKALHKEGGIGDILFLQLIEGVGT